MPGEAVIDASVLAKCFFTEDGSAAARAFVVSGASLLAPDLLFVEIASIAAKRTRRGEVPHDVALKAAGSVGEFLSETIPTASLSVRAFELAAAHGFSAYDGVYLALAEARGAAVMTADVKLARRAEEAGLGALVSLLVSPETGPGSP